MSAPTDRELLERAAKAAGLSIDKTETNGGGRGNTGFDMMGNAVLDWHNNVRWNPLTDHGDALRLMAKLGIQASVCLGFQAEATDDEAVQCLCRAIVRVAAAIATKGGAT